MAPGERSPEATCRIVGRDCRAETRHAETRSTPSANTVYRGKGCNAYPSIPMGVMTQNRDRGRNSSSSADSVENAVEKERITPSTHMQLHAVLCSPWHVVGEMHGTDTVRRIRQLMYVNLYVQASGVLPRAGTAAGGDVQTQVDRGSAC